MILITPIITIIKQKIFHKEYQHLQERTNQLNKSIASLESERLRHCKVTEKYKAIINVKELEKEIANCKSKKIYDTEAEAEYAALALYYWDKRIVRPYKCKVCCKFHLTHSNKLSHLVSKELVFSKVKTMATAPISDHLDRKTRALLNEMRQ